MLYDTFAFFRELDVLEIRLEEMAAVDCKHILIESTITHSGQKKPLYYNECKSRFDKFKDKIIHVIADDIKITGDAWDVEGAQRDYFTRLKIFKDDDIIMVSDMDEIPRATVINVTDFPELLKTHNLLKLKQMFFYYYFNLCKGSWTGTIITDYKRVRTTSPTTMRRVWRKKEGLTIREAGWHFSFIGGPESIKEKVRAYAHTELNNDKYIGDSNIIKCITDGIDLFGRGNEKMKVVSDDLLPKYLINNKEKFKEFFYNG